MIDLYTAGLSATEAKMYKTLLSKKEWRPAEIAKSVSESRTNSYKILDDLTEMGLATRYDKAKKLHYRAAHPSRLMELARAKRTKQEESEIAFERNLKEMMSEYTMVHEQANVRYFNGKEGLTKMYNDMLGSGQNIYVLRSPQDDRFMGKEFYNSFTTKRADKGIKTCLITSNPISIPHAVMANSGKHTVQSLLRTDEYTAPVEWSVYADKLSVISFGDEALGMIIESKQIADSFKQIFSILNEQASKQQ